jgi:hypothetical protein
MPFWMDEHGRSYRGPTLRGPWTEVQPVTESLKHRPPRRKIMRRKSPPAPAPVLDEYDRECNLIAAMEGFPNLAAAARRRKAQLGERPRRKVREQAEVVPLRFDEGAIDHLCDQLKQFLKRGAGQGGAELTYSEADDYWHELLDATQKEPSAADEALEEAFGIPAPARRGGGMSNEAFLTSLMDSAW